ncbi:hypothetical protein [Cupriavidus campinensis]
MTAPNARIAALDAGTYFHHATLNDPQWRGAFHRIVYTPALSDAALDDIDVLYVASWQDAELLKAAAPVIHRFLDRGKTVVAMGENHAQDWLPGVVWRPRPVNFWWWLTPGADSGLRMGEPDHALWRHITLADATWHQHGYFEPPPGARRLVELAEGGCILYEDCVTTPGRLIVTSLDPCYHHGSYFMPATTRFLRGFLPWLLTLGEDPK